jgi:zinc D-Ala-D-Ala carboxypeptidase
MNTFTTGQLLIDLGISPEIVANRQLFQYEEAESLELAEVGNDNREHFLIREAATAWRQLKDSAEKDGETIIIISAFRSVSHQAEIIRDKIKGGMDIDEILSVCAPPGFSEHHTGRALDISTPGVENLSEDFENSTAFEWLDKNARKFNYFLSYPRGNPFGYKYEPWHWCYDAT